MHLRTLLAVLAPLALGACTGNDSNDTSGAAPAEIADARTVSVNVTGMT